MFLVSVCCAPELIDRIIIKFNHISDELIGYLFSDFPLFRHKIYAILGPG